MRKALEWPLQLEPGLSDEDRSTLAERSRRALHRLGASDVTVEVSDDRLTLACSIEVTSEDPAELKQFIEGHFEVAIEAPMITFVDEYKLRPRDPATQVLRSELARLLEERRLWFDIYPLPGFEGIVIQLQDVGGQTFEEAQALGRRIIQEVYEQAIFNLTGRREWHRGKGPDEFMP